MSDERLTKFKNDKGVPEICIDVKEFKCVGASPPHDHPHIYLEMGVADLTLSLLRDIVSLPAAAGKMGETLGVGLIRFVGPSRKHLVRYARINANDRRFGTSPRSKESGGLRTRAEFDQTPPANGPTIYRLTLTGSSSISGRIGCQTCCGR